MKISGSLLAVPIMLTALAEAEAQNTPQKVWTLQSPVVSLGYCQLTGVNTVTTLASCTNGIPAAPGGTLGPVYVLVQANQPLNWRDDGTAPTSTTGMLLTSNTVLTMSTNPMTAFQFIPTGSSATVSAVFYAVR